MPTIFFTGFPGFLGSELLPRVLERSPPEVRAVCLVQSKFRPVARARLQELERSAPALAGRIALVEGDIAAPDLGLAQPAELKSSITQVFHLAAVYDLAVRREVGLRINVEGTRQVLDFAQSCPALERFQYVSTCYVSGRFAGAFTEDDLEMGQAFNNHYEETKYLAELDVQRRRKQGLPATIYRPSIVAGDSVSGATQKYDGPYFIMQLLLRQGRIALMPMVGRPEMTRVNVVPRDFVVRALVHLSGLPISRGKVYHLCDPAPLTVGQMVEVLGRATEKRLVKVPLPAELAKAALARVPGIEKLLRIPPEALDYFTHPTFYTCSNALADLAGSGIGCPAFPEYAPRLVGFMREHPEIGAAGMA